MCYVYTSSASCSRLYTDLERGGLSVAGELLNFQFVVDGGRELVVHSKVYSVSCVIQSVVRQWIKFNIINSGDS